MPTLLRALAILCLTITISACGSVREQPGGDDAGDDATAPDADPGVPPADADPSLPDGPVEPPPDGPVEPLPDAPPAPECHVSADCDEPGRPYCVAGSCAECDSATSCTADEPVCSTADHTCGGCTGDGQCAAYADTPACGPDGACVECTANADCGGATPYCVANQCEECDSATSCTADEPVCSASSHTCGGCTGDAQCAAYADSPVCGPGGACVECTANADCGGGTPVCEGNTCRACESGSDCASGECHLDTGACYLPGELVYLSPSGNDANACTKNARCATFARAVQLLTATKDTITLSTGVYVESLTIPATVGDVEVLGHGATLRGPLDTKAHATTIKDLIIDQPGGWFPSYCSTAQTTCTFERVISNVDLYTGTATINLIDFSSSGFIVNGGFVTARRASFTDGRSVMLSGNYDIRNSVFARNISPIYISAGGSASLPHRFENNTVVDNGTWTQTSQTLDLQCGAGVTGSFRNNIVWSSFAPDPTSRVTQGCPLTYSLVYSTTSTPYPGTANIVGIPRLMRIYPAGSLPADFHIAPTSPCRDTADPANPIPDDMDGDARPIGGRADMGADEYKP